MGLCHAPFEYTRGPDPFVEESRGRRIRSCRGRQGRYSVSMRIAWCVLRTRQIDGVAIGRLHSIVVVYVSLPDRRTDANSAFCVVRVSFCAQDKWLALRRRGRKVTSHLQRNVCLFAYMHGMDMAVVGMCEPRSYRHGHAGALSMH